MALQIYPDVSDASIGVPAIVPFQWSENQLVLVSEFETGREQRRLVWDSPRRAVRLDYRYTSLENADEIYGFYKKMSGPLTAFLFFFPTFNSYINERVGTASGGETRLYLPSMGATNYTLRLFSAPLDPGTNYNFVPYTGPGLGSDYADMLIPVSQGDKFYFSFTGRLKIKSRFDTDPISSEEIGSCYYTFSTSIIQLQHEVDTL